MEVSIREMKNNFSRYLKRVQAGEEVIITDRGRPVTRLGPVPQVGATSLEDALERLRASHLIRPGKVVARVLAARARRPRELIARFRSLPWVRPGTGKKPALPKPLIRIDEGEKTLAEIVSEQRR